MRPTSGISVLVIDDDAAIRGLLTNLLQRASVQVECAPDGDSGMMLMESRTYSVIILDLMLPVVDGFEILRRISETMPGMLKRVIVLTAISRRTLERLGDGASVWRIMRKPFDIDDLLASVTACAAQDVCRQPEM